MSRPKPQSPEGAPDDHVELGNVLGFMRLLWAVAHGLGAASKQMQSSVGVTGPQRLAVRIVGHYGSISPGELARVLRLHPSSLTGVLRRLEEATFIEREVDPRDGRRAVLRLTRAGERLDAQRAGTVEAAVRAALSTLPDGMVRAAEDVLRQLAAELELRWGGSGARQTSRSAPRPRPRTSATRRQK